MSMTSNELKVHSYRVPLKEKKVTAETLLDEVGNYGKITRIIRITAYRYYNDENIHCKSTIKWISGDRRT